MSTKSHHQAATGRLQMRLITHNVRYATNTPSPGERPWAERCPRLCAQLSFITVSRDSAFVCLQEVLHEQLRDIAEGLGGSRGGGGGGTEWAHIGVGRDDGSERGEYSPIFYRHDAWQCERTRTYWLSETPEKPSRGWDAALPRIVTVGRFRHRASGVRIVVMSTHLDHRGRVARRESAKLLLRIAAEWAVCSGDDAAAAAAVSAPAEPLGPAIPVFLGGDFNSTPDGGAYKEIVSPDGGMTDISSLVAKERWYGNREITYTSFGEPNERPAKIDFLFVQDSASARAVTFGVLANRFDDGVYLSDHRAVVADVEIVPGESGV